MTATASSERPTSAHADSTDAPWVSRLGRAGLVTRGLLHIVVAWLAFRVATGEPGRRVDQVGALTTVVRQPLGRFLVLALALGLLAYAAWRIAEAVLDPEDAGVPKRIGCALRAALYLMLCASAVRLVIGGGSATGGDTQTQDMTASVLAWPFGRVLVGLAGLVVAGIGLWNGWRAVTGGFEKDLKRYEMSRAEQVWTMRLGRLGHLARMVAFGLAGYFLVLAAIRFDPKKGVGLDAALHELAARSYGTAMLVTVAAGLAAFGLFQLAMARYRQILGD